MRVLHAVLIPCVLYVESVETLDAEVKSALKDFDSIQAELNDNE